jgi:DNA repair exonuclease SbcCD ATPase subunit
MKKVNDEFDKFTSSYLSTKIKNLEPIINNIISNIGFNASFCVNASGDFDIRLKRDNKEFSYKDLSSGERIIFSMAFQLAILLNNNETGFIIADEGLSVLDENNLTMAFELFRNLPFQLLCVVHRAVNIPNSIKVIKLS